MMFLASSYYITAFTCIPFKFKNIAMVCAVSVKSDVSFHYYFILSHLSY